MTNELKLHQQAMLANMEVLHSILKETEEVIKDGIEVAATGQQNELIGGLMTIENKIKSIESLYNSIIILHLANPQERKYQCPQKQQKPQR